MRLQTRGVAVVLFAILSFTCSQAQTAIAIPATAGTSGKTSATRPSVPRIIVKLRGDFAAKVEAALPLTTMALNPGTSANPAIDMFMNQHSAKRLSPVYAGLVRAKKQRHVSDGQIVQEIRNKFAKRAARMREAMTPPEISRTYVLELSDAAAGRIGAIIDMLNRNTNVEWAEEDHVDAAIYTPNDPYFSSYGTWGRSYDDLWGTKLIGAPAAWDVTRGDGVIVAVVDTGIDLGHPDIAANLWTNPNEVAANGIDDDGDGYVDDVYGWDFIGSSYVRPAQGNNPVDHFGHGSHVAGTIAAVGDNSTGIVGVAWHAKVMAVKGLDNNGYGLDSTLGPAITYAANQGADIISNSWGGSGSSQTIADAISYAYSLGAVVVAAAGNNDDDARNYYPANLWNVITVGATNPPSSGYEYKAYFSNWGSKIDVTAPGVDILSLRAAGTTMGTPVDAYYTRADGTSMATPHVSGAAALILAAHPQYSNEQVRQILRASANDPGPAGFDLDFGYGRINAANALAHTNPLEAKISNPIDGTHVKVSTAISGVAQGNTFSSYKLEYGAGHLPTTWTTIQIGVTPVSGTLGVFDPGALPDGVYVIRLTAYNTAGQAFVDRIELIVDYVTITNPVPPRVPSVAAEYKPGAVISITGTANGASFQNFAVDWAEGINPGTGWSTTGVSLIGGGATPITNSVVATLDTSSIMQADYYTIRLTVNNAGYTSQASTLVYLEPDLLSTGWPKWLDQAPYLNFGFVPAINADGSIRLTLMNPRYGNTTLPAKYWSFAPDGSNQYTAVLNNNGDYLQPAAGDFDGLPGQEVLISETNSIALFHPDNSVTRLRSTNNVSFEYALPVLEDLNGDSQSEIVTLGSNLSLQQAYLFAWQRNGQQLNANFPVTLADQNTDMRYSQAARVLVGDVDGDGQREIIAQEGTTAASVTLRMFASDGTQKAGWPNPSFNGYATNMILADLDHNGTLEIVVLIRSNNQKAVHVLQPDGTERPGWPLILTSTGVAQVAVGDLDRDGHEEIIIVNGAISVFNSNGTLFSGAFPIRPPNGFQQFSGLAVADVDGDGYPEILTGQDQLKNASNPLLPQLVRTEPTVESDGTISRDAPRVAIPNADAYSPNSYYEPRLLVIRRDGTTWKSWRMMGANENQPFYMAGISVGDFNQDGYTDIGLVYLTVSGGGTSGYLSEGVATVLTTGSTFVAANNDWPLAFRSARNTALFRRDQSPPTVAIISPTGAAGGTAVVSIAAADNDEVSRIELYVDGTLRGSTAVAPFAVNWDTTADAGGPHWLTAKAYDPSGNVATSDAVQVMVHQPATANAGGPYAGIRLQAVSFDGSRSSDADGDPLTYKWNFGDGTTGSGATPTHTYTTLGTFTVSLVVNDGYVDSPAAATTATITEALPIANPGGPYSGTRTHAIAFDGTGSSDMDGDSLTYRWNFGDGSTGAGAAPAHTYTTLGTFTVSLIVNDGHVDSTSATTTVTITNVQPTVSLTAPAGGAVYQVPAAITLTATASDPDGTVTSVQFFQNSTSVGTVTSAPYTFTWTNVPQGSYTLTAVATDNNGATTTSTASTIIVTASMMGASPATVAFGNQTVNTSAPVQTVTVTNTGNGTLHINSAIVSGNSDFYQLTNNCVGGPGIAPGSSCSVQLEFTPHSFGAESATLTLGSDAVNGPVSVPLTGTGANNAPTFSPANIAFGNVYVGKTSSNKTIKLTSNGPSALTISAISVSAGFTQTNNCPASLSAGSSCNITVAFAPTGGGTFSGVLSVIDNGAGSPQTVPLTGAGLDFAVAVSPASVSVPAGGKATYTVTLTPIGGSYSSNVSLTCSNLPTAAKCSFSPSGVTLGSTPANSTLTVSTVSGSTSTPPGSYLITIKGTANNTTHSTTATLVVN